MLLPRRSTAPSANPRSPSAGAHSNSSSQARGRGNVPTFAFGDDDIRGRQDDAVYGHGRIRGRSGASGASAVSSRSASLPAAPRSAAVLALQAAQAALQHPARRTTQPVGTAHVRDASRPKSPSVRSRSAAPSTASNDRSPARSATWPNVQPVSDPNRAYVSGGRLLPPRAQAQKASTFKVRAAHRMLYDCSVIPLPS